jgi:hypothetical protein
MALVGPERASNIEEQKLSIGVCLLALPIPLSHPKKAKLNPQQVIKIWGKYSDIDKLVEEIQINEQQPKLEGLL